MGHDYRLQKIYQYIWATIMGYDYGLRLWAMIMGYDYGL